MTRVNLSISAWVHMASYLEFLGSLLRVVCHLNHVEAPSNDSNDGSGARYDGIVTGYLQEACM